MAFKIAINGFGRIGLAAARLLSQRNDLQLVAINATSNIDTSAHLLKYDSVHGCFAKVQKLDAQHLLIASDTVRFFNDREIHRLNFSSCEVDLVLECTGKFLSQDTAKLHLKDKVKKVLISAPTKDDTPMFVYGINHQVYKGQNIASNASCTTNALAPLVKILDDALSIQNGFMTTVHSYTNDQNVLDSKHPKDLRRARASALNIIPTGTGAAKAIGKILPHLDGKLCGHALRVPTPNVSLIDLTVTLKKTASLDLIQDLFIHASQNNLKNLLGIDNEKCVSSDFIGSSFSSVYIPDLTQVNGNLVKISAWYDNEYAYTARLLDMAKVMLEYKDA